MVELKDLEVKYCAGHAERKQNDGDHCKKSKSTLDDCISRVQGSEVASEQGQTSGA